MFVLWNVAYLVNQRLKFFLMIICNNIRNQKKTWFTAQYIKAAGHPLVQCNDPNLHTISEMIEKENL